MFDEAMQQGPNTADDALRLARSERDDLSIALSSRDAKIAELETTIGFVKAGEHAAVAAEERVRNDNYRLLGYLDAIREALGKPDSGSPKCPQCGGELREVTYSRDGMLNSEQFDAVRAGDYFCKKCPGKESNDGYKYFWKRDLAKDALTTCDNCELAMPIGCGHMYGNQLGCPLGPRKDPAWIAGKAVWDNLTDRRGIKQELEACDLATQLEIIETLGKIALRVANAGRNAGAADAGKEGI